MDKSDGYRARVEQLIAKLTKANVLRAFDVSKFVRDVVEEAQVELSDTSILALISIQLDVAVDEAMRKGLMEGTFEASDVTPNPRSRGVHHDDVRRWITPVHNIVFTSNDVRGGEDDGPFLRRAGIKPEDS